MNTDAANRRKEIVNDCLAVLVEKGLTRTTTRDLSRAMHLQTSGMYYYFATKDDLIIACAEEAISRVEAEVLLPALREAHRPGQMIERLLESALQMAPTMKFFVSVCTDTRYAEAMGPVLDRVSMRYARYAVEVARTLQTEAKEIAPFVFMLITAISNYMVFEEASFVSPQLRAVQIKFERIAAAAPGETGDKEER